MVNGIPLTLQRLASRARRIVEIDDGTNDLLVDWSLDSLGDVLRDTNIYIITITLENIANPSISIRVRDMLTARAVALAEDLVERGRLQERCSAAAAAAAAAVANPWLGVREPDDQHRRWKS